MQDTIANALNRMMNAMRAGKESCTVPSSKLLLGLLEIMKKNRYVESYRAADGKAEIKIGKLNDCKAIKPRFYVQKGEYDKYVRRLLPSREFGILIVSTSKGIMTHRDAIDKGIGGSLIAFCF